MQIADDVAVEHHSPAQFDLLADDSSSRLDGLGNGSAVGKGRRPERLDVGWPGRSRNRDDVGGQLLEVRILGHEVGLAGQLDHRGAFDRYQPVRRDALGSPLCCPGRTFHAKQLDGRIEGAVGFLQRLLGSPSSRRRWCPEAA